VFCVLHQSVGGANTIVLTDTLAFAIHQDSRVTADTFFGHHLAAQRGVRCVDLFTVDLLGLCPMLLVVLCGSLHKEVPLRLKPDTVTTPVRAKQHHIVRGLVLPRVFG
jgi:hypothetical protein